MPELLIAPFDYTCRICENEKTAYVQVQDDEGEAFVKHNRIRIARYNCSVCGKRTTHVLTDDRVP